MIIKCKFSILDWSQIGDLYGCEVEVISIDDPYSLTEVQGDHLSGNCNDDVEFFRLQNHGDLRSIPKQIEKFFRNILVLQWTSGNIASITADDLEPFPNLRSLVMYSNKIEHLDSDLFKHSQKLQVIYFGFNLIKHVGPGLLSSLTNLKRADFAGNLCVDFYAPTSKEILELTDQLTTKCAATDDTAGSTNTENVCSAKILANDKDDSKLEILNEIKELRKEMSEIFAKYNARLEELEHKIEDTRT